ncbi:MAG TPA: hypothetical protein VFR91_07615 [Dyella sp.]|nr:hypothetical protein [Dyella sp.]
MKQGNALPVWIRILAALLALGGLVGIGMVILLMVRTGSALGLIAVPFGCIYLAIAVAAVAMACRSRAGLHWTRLLLLVQTPMIRTSWLVYWLHAGISLDLFAGARFGFQTYLGANFQFNVQFGSGLPGGTILGINVLALAAFFVLGRADRHFDGPPPAATDAPVDEAVSTPQPS